MSVNINSLLPVLGLVCWTLLMWIALYATRLPAMKRMKIDPNDARHPNSAYKELIPPFVRPTADNYNHLHEQPTIFYPLMFFAAMTGGGDDFLMMAGWTYVGLRVVHSFVQIVVGTVVVRFLVFSASTIVLFVIAGREVMRLMGS